jgi:hypothetical protein
MRALLGFVLMMATATAQSRNPSTPKAEGSDPTVKYDTATEVRLFGTVEEVREKSSPAALKGIHIVLDVDERRYQIYLCPSSFLKFFDITLQRGDSLVITGSRVKVEGADFVLARQMRKRNDVLELRDSKGNPYWEDERLRRTLTWNRTAPGQAPNCCNKPAKSA